MRIAVPLLLWTFVAIAFANAVRADSCHDWRSQHREIKAEVAGLYLAGAAQVELDAALFDLLQREAYLTACRTAVDRDRVEMIGWRVLGRAPEHFASAVVESILEQAGFDLALERLGPRTGALAAVPADDHSGAP